MRPMRESRYYTLIGLVVGGVVGSVGVLALTFLALEWAYWLSLPGLIGGSLVGAVTFKAGLGPCLPAIEVHSWSAVLIINAVLYGGLGGLIGNSIGRSRRRRR